MSKKLGPEDIEKIIKETRPFISLDHKTYKGRKEPAKFIDSDYGEFWITPQTLLYRREAVHPKRKNKILRQRNVWSKVATKNTVPLKEVQKKLPPHLKIQEETYKGTSLKCLFIDSEYGGFEARPIMVLRGKASHPKRQPTDSQRWKTSKLSFDEIKTRVENAGATLIEVQDSKLKVRCSKGHIKNVNRSIFLKRKRKSQYECVDCGSFLSLTEKEVKQRYSEFGFELLEPYKDARTPTLIKCSKGHSFYYSIKAFISNSSPACSRCGGSGLEKEIIKFIETELGHKVKNQDRELIKPKELDIVIKEKGLAIEATGLYWHTERTRPKNYHYEKNLACIKNGIKLLTLYEDEWKFKNPIVKSLIKYHLGISSLKINARNCVIKDLSYKESKSFLEENHLMGSTTHRAFGLFYQGKLVSVLSYKKTGTVLEIVRFCSLIDTSVRGAFGKLVEHLKSTIKSTKIISWVDLRYGNGISYEKLGFKWVKTTLGWKWTDFIKTYNRLYCRANMDERKLTQAEYAEELKLEKIYDCGQALYELKT